MTDRECVALLQWALPRLGLRWRGFSNLRGQVCKRISRRMKALGMTDVAEYRALLERDDAEWRVLDAACRVTITRFYRDRAVFDVLREALLPQAARVARAERRPLRVWSAGAASGEEPYTLAALLRFDVAPNEPSLHFEVLASELDAALVERARRATFPTGALKELPEELRAQAFGPGAGPDELTLIPEVTSAVSFREEDIRASMPEGPFDLVLCRNLAFTYFGPELQERVLSDMVERMRPGGLLVIGGHERLPKGAEERWSLTPASGPLPIFRYGRAS